ncbi:MAG: tetratricopeptide repeat protein [Gammaproteobacteria bacterium]
MNQAPESGDTQKRLAAARALLARDPADTNGLLMLAEGLLGARQPERALSALERLPPREQDNARRLMLEGRARNNLGDLNAAETAFRRLLQVEPDNAGAHSNLGHVLRGLMRSQDAEQHLRRAIEIEPEHCRALQTLAAVCLASGRTGEAVEALQTAARVQTDNPVLLGHLGAALHRNGDFPAAERAYKAALALDPDQAEVWLNLGITLQDTDRLAQAVPAYERAVSTAPGSIAARIRLIEALLARGDSQAALRAVESAQALDPAHPSLLAARSLALLGVGRTPEADALLDVPRLVSSIDLDPPPGWDSMRAFNLSLAEHVLGHPTLAYEPEGNATRRGRHTGNLLEGEKGPVALLEQAVRVAVTRYTEQLDQPPDHPFPGPLPGALKLTMWSVVMDTAGHQLPHIHPAAWLSGVYYVELPPSLGDGNDHSDGWIEFGLPPEELQSEPGPALHAFAPAEGRLFLFPSYFYHRTMPFEGPARRISIAFDVLRRVPGG